MAKYILEPIIANYLLQINCIEAFQSNFRDKLLIGTQNKGVIIYDVLDNGQGRSSTQLDAVHKELSAGLPVSQLNIVEQWGCLLVLSQGDLCAYKYTISKSFTFTYHSTLPHHGITKYTLFRDTAAPVVCLAVPGGFHLYKFTGQEFQQVHVLSFAQKVLDIALTGTRLFVVYVKRGEELSTRPATGSGCFTLSTRIFTSDIYTCTSYPPCITAIDYNTVLFHEDYISTVYEDGSPGQKISWNMPPRDIRIWKECCVGIQGNGVEIVRLGNSGGMHGLVSINSLSTLSSLQHMAVSDVPYVASSNAVWRLSLDYSPVSSTSSTSSATTTIPSTLSIKQKYHETVAGYRKAENDPIADIYMDQARSKLHAEAVEKKTILEQRKQNPPGLGKEEMKSHLSVDGNNISPSNSISVLGLSREERIYFNQFKIYTVEEFSQLTATSVKFFYGMKYWDMYIQAIIAVQRKNPKIVAPQSFNEISQQKEKEAMISYSKPTIIPPTAVYDGKSSAVYDVSWYKNPSRPSEGLNTNNNSTSASSRIEELARLPYGNIGNIHDTWEPSNASSSHIDQMINRSREEYSSTHSEMPSFYQDVFVNLAEQDNNNNNERGRNRDPNRYFDYKPQRRPGDTFENVFPEDPLEAIGMAQHQIEFLATLDVFTVRQFAQISHTEVSGYDDELAARHLVAVQCIEAHPEKVQKIIDEAPPTLTHYGYLYMPSSEFSKFLDNRELKSAYVLFQEYLECAPEKRHEHQWKQVYLKYLDIATAEFPTPPPPGNELILSDADVFSYICWNHAKTIAKLDVTAAARAIYFYWDKIPSKMLNELQQLSRSDLIEYKFENVLRINLSLLCHNYSGKLFNRRSRFSNKEYREWYGVALEEYDLATHSHSTMAKAEYFNEPTGCIVLPTGVVTQDCIATMLKS